jgi:PAS domain S-box-containing protein
MELLGFLKGSRRFRKPRPNDIEHRFSQGEILVSKTNTRGIITYANEKFIALSGYSQKELLGQPHNLTRHPKMPRIIFKLLWKELKAGQEINAYVVNLAKDGGYYWVFANVTPSFDVTGNIIGFHSTRRRPNRKGLAAIRPLYELLRKHEIVGGIDASEIILHSFLKEKGLDYDEFIFNIQHS